MNIISNSTTKPNWRVFSLLFSVFSICAASYVITPLLPIYFIESYANGGLAWSKADAFSVFGTFLALMYIAPFFGGLLGDFVFGKPLTAFLGYLLLGSGIVALTVVRSLDTVSLALLALGLGIGFVKVNLTAAIGRLPYNIRQKCYEYHYIASSLGFMTGGVLSNPIFSFGAMPAVSTASLVCTAASILFFLAAFGKQLFMRSQEEDSPRAVSATPSPKQHDTPAFLFLIALGIPFFLCSNQLATGMPVFLHQCVNRSVGSWTIPTLWFGAIGSLTMTLLSPWLRKGWLCLSSTSRRIEPLKFSVGFIIISASFAITALFATFDQSTMGVSGLPLMACIHITCFIADFHVRPVLFSAATSLVKTRYHTLSTALVYACIGLGGKLAGTLASFVDSIGFSMIFSICSSVAVVCGVASFIWWRRISISQQTLTPVSPDDYSVTQSTSSRTLP